MSEPTVAEVLKRVTDDSRPVKGIVILRFMPDNDETIMDCTGTTIADINWAAMLLLREVMSKTTAANSRGAKWKDDVVLYDADS